MQDLYTITTKDIEKINLPYVIREPFYDYGQVGNLSNGKYCVEYNSEKYYMTYSVELEIFKKYVDKRKQKAKFNWTIKPKASQ